MFIKPLAPFYRVLATAPDKSITHRAIMFNAIANGTATISNALLGHDCLSTISCMRDLGAKIEISGDKVKVRGNAKLTSGDVDAGNSGTTARLLAGLVCGRGITVRIDGDNSLRSRPMLRVVTPLSQMGGDITATEGKLPLKIRSARLTGISYNSPNSSAQVKSAVLLAGLSAEGATSVTEQIKSRNHTEILLKNMGADIVENGNTVTVRRSELTAADVFVPGDISSAAYLLGLAGVTKNSRITVQNVGLNATRTGLLTVLAQAGADLTVTEKGGVEPYGDITIANKPLSAFTITGDLVPSLIDEIPLLAALACFADGISTISGAAELKVKESDRIASTVSALSALGADITPTADGMIINGHGGLKGGGRVETFGDHRIAMAAAVAAAGSALGGEIVGHECADISYPGFFDLVGGGL